MTRTTIPTDHKHPYWQGYDHCVKAISTVLYDLQLACDTDNQRQGVQDLLDSILARCGTAVMLANVRNRSPEYRRKQIRVVK